MKKCIDTAFFYAVAALAGGVYFREFTKFNQFTGVTALGKLHTHLFLLGMVIFMLLAALDAPLSLTRAPGFGRFYLLYNAGVALTAVMMAIRGTVQVLALPLSRGADAALSGVAGIGHILTGISLLLLFLLLRQAAAQRHR